VDWHRWRPGVDKIARRVIREGGKVWERGTGPMVGRYRVDCIAASGEAVIGCHTFTAEESNRMLDLLNPLEGN